MGAWGECRALGRVYHPTHFTCQGCGIGLAGTSFKEAGGEPYCGECKKNIQVAIDPTIHICAKCKNPIIGEYILLFGQRMHPEVRSKGHRSIAMKSVSFSRGLHTRARAYVANAQHFQCDMCGKDLRNGDCHEYQGTRTCL